MRGDYPPSQTPPAAGPELPPRARRILDEALKQNETDGTTSACAENTSAVSTTVSGAWNYLRVRGEYAKALQNMGIEAELPPRARRIQAAGGEGHHSVGTTSACAETTYHPPPRSKAPWNYLRVRGVYGVWMRTHRAMVELPPRARRIHLHKTRRDLISGTTSACAENTTSPHGAQVPAGNYLRVRGEYLIRLETLKIGIGTTSACAENTEWRAPS